MDLIPVAQLAKEQARIEDRSGVHVEAIVYRELFKEIRTVGKLDYNERQVAFIPARINGRVHKVFADFTGMEVRKDTHLLEIYSPELLVTLQSLLSSSSTTGVELTRERLRAWGILDEQIKQIEQSKKVEPYLTIHAPIGGTVIEKNVRIGQYVKEGDVLYRIANIDPIWLYLDIYEFDLGWLLPGQAVKASVEAFAGEVFPGMVTFIDPFLDEKTRTVRARVNLPNPEKKLRPGMYASVTLRIKLGADGKPEPTGLEGKYVCYMHPEVVAEKPGKCAICEMPLERVPDRKPLLPTHKHHEGHKHAEQSKTGNTVATGKLLAIPVGAVLDTGRRKIAYRQNKEGAYELVELKLGPRADAVDERGVAASYFPVLGGLAAGDRIVVRGAFLLDSQRQIEGMPSLLHPQGQSAAGLHSGHGAMPAPKAEHNH
jgi:Cu(I)/Ag(I) efflux system membrane fusion protein